MKRPPSGRTRSLGRRSVFAALTVLWIGARRADIAHHPDRDLHALRRRREPAGRLYRPRAVRRLGVLRLRQLCRRASSSLGGYGNDLVALVVAVLFSTVLGLLIGALILRRTRALFLAADARLLADRLRDRLQMDGGDRRRERAAGRAAHDLSLRPRAITSSSSSTVVAVFWLLWRIAHSPFGRALQAVRDNEQRASSLGYNVYRLRLYALDPDGGGRRLRRRAAHLHAARRLRRQSELAARRRQPVDDGARRRPSFPRAAVGRDRSSSCCRTGCRRSRSEHRRELVADLRADPDGVRAVLARRRAGSRAASAAARRAGR